MFRLKSLLLLIGAVGFLSISKSQAQEYRLPPEVKLQESVIPKANLDALRYYPKFFVDLVVSDTRRLPGLAGSIRKQGNFFSIPIEVIIKNQGNRPATPFKVATHFVGSNGTFLAAFSKLTGQTSWYQFVNHNLAGGASVSLKGRVLISDRYAGQIIRIYAVADSCAGEEFTPSYCRVREINENNNQGPSISVRLPGRLYAKSK